MTDHLSPDLIEARLLDFLRSEIYDPSVPIETDTDLIAAGLDSFSLLKILIYIEKEFDLRIPDSEINEERMRSVKNLSRLINELLQRP